MNATHPGIPGLFEYNDFRRFLSDYIEARSRVDDGFTKSSLCRKLGIPNSRSYINDVINGKTVTPSYVERFVRALAFGREEAQFFRVLVKLNQVSQTSPEEYELYFSQLISLNRTPKRILDKKTFAFYSDWRHSAVRTMLDIINFKDDYRELARSMVPPIRPKQARESIELLKSLGLIALDESGYYKMTDRAVTTPDWCGDIVIKQYQAQWLDLARQTVLSPEKMPRRMATNLVSISEKGYNRLVDKIAQFRAEVRSLVNKDEYPADRIYQLGIQFFPAGQIIKKDAP